MLEGVKFLSAKTTELFAAVKKDGTGPLPQMSHRSSLVIDMLSDSEVPVVSQYFFRMLYVRLTRHVSTQLMLEDPVKAALYALDKPFPLPFPVYGFRKVHMDPAYMKSVIEIARNFRASKNKKYWDEEIQAFEYRLAQLYTAMGTMEKIQELDAQGYITPELYEKILQETTVLIEAAQQKSTPESDIRNSARTMTKAYEKFLDTIFGADRVRVPVSSGGQSGAASESGMTAAQRRIQPGSLLSIDEA